MQRLYVLLLKKFFLFVVLSICLCIFICGLTLPGYTEDFQFKKQPEIQQVKPKKPVRIKLKRSVKGEYTWELTGDNADEVVGADKRLRQLLKVE